ncbi:uncharacterized protein Z519_09205 [Cladophialophora bantiana CBS 173.52]|uniref:Uncharacterized protein n=1 Tax=Cladophialophora bantiana (strain ATCC 10958 / CBS 173.52 / CDC B-1940 / NIH 8579) TaxID=1442370 RepID=A0A0D2HBF8_CLAB1|nr:uncharacterized protein Z519_09205 [Cladophialophora bantiana CBS 173.52]KIW90558.1 hypothetical protein Z519_09205 [Cladophialophora bantiana CBS 173.52]
MEPEMDNVFTIRGYIRAARAQTTKEDVEIFKNTLIKLCLLFFVYHLGCNEVLSSFYQTLENPREGLPKLKTSASTYLQNVINTIKASFLLLLMAQVLGVPGTTTVCCGLLVFSFLQEWRPAIARIFNILTPILSSFLHKCKDCLDPIAFAVRLAVLAHRLYCVIWQFGAYIVNSLPWNTLKNTFLSVTCLVFRCPFFAFVDFILELKFRMSGGREDLRKVSREREELRGTVARLKDENAALRLLQAKPKDNQGVWIRERPSPSGQQYSFQFEQLRKHRQQSQAAHKQSQRWQKLFEERQARIDELEANDADAEARVIAATAHRDERIRALEAEMRTAAASAASEVNALMSALEAEEAESHRLRSSLEAGKAKSGNLESLLESVRVVSQGLGQDVAAVRCATDEASALLDKVRMEAAEAERAAASRVRERKDAEISVLKNELAEAQADAVAVVVVDTAEIGVQTDLAAEASPVNNSVDVNDAGTQTECISLDIQSQLEASAKCGSKLLETKKALEERGKELLDTKNALEQRGMELASFQHAWKKTSDTLIQCNEHLQRTLKEASELRSCNNRGNQQLQLTQREVQQLKEILAIREEQAKSIMNQLQRCQQRDQQQQPVAQEVQYWRERTEAISNEMTRLRAEHVEVKGKLEEIQQRFKAGASHFHNLQRDATQQLEAKEKREKELEAELARARDVQRLDYNSQVESLQKQVMTKDEEIHGLRRQLDQQNMAAEVAVNTPKSGRIGVSPFPTPTKTPIMKVLENTVLEHEKDKKRHALEKEQFERRIAAQATDIVTLRNTNDHLEEKNDHLEDENQRLQTEIKKLQDQIEGNAMTVGFAEAFLEEDKEEVKQAQEEAESWKTQYDEAQASVQNMQLDLQFKEGQVDAARMEAKLYKTQAQNLQVEQAPIPQPDHLPSLRQRPNKRIASEDLKEELEQPVQERKKIMARGHYQGQLTEARRPQAPIIQPPQAQTFRPQYRANPLFPRGSGIPLQLPQIQVTQPQQAPITQTAWQEDEEEAEEKTDDSSIISEEE